MDKAQLEQLKVDFEQFREYCILLRGTHNTFFALYDDAETQEILHQTAEWFFDDLHTILIESFFLRVGRICDPAQMRNNSNLSMHYIFEQLNARNLATTDIGELVSKIDSYNSLTKPARNKAIAHNDLKSSRGGSILGGHTQEELDSFLQSLNQFTDRVAEKLDLAPLDYSVQAGKGDVQDLIKLLKNALPKKDGK